MPPSIRRKLINVSPLYLSLAVTYAHVFLSPYTKVEESFTLHAVHDVLAYGHRPDQLVNVGLHLTSYPRADGNQWDHITFPGAVPRSFVPPILLGVLTYPLSVLAVYMGWIRTKLGIQILGMYILANRLQY